MRYVGNCFSPSLVLVLLALLVPLMLGMSQGEQTPLLLYIPVFPIERLFTHDLSVLGSFRVMTQAQIRGD
ncbi:hypothetical protein XELAEV_18014160mg [Xenopus laevis]|uniref:Uncharacterized protein n=1 Tax=Xenopus laevis TaxID=8355 RepID=A0A974DGS0_XENLA|nr:hypothetical protein XELAEV_18014160mg [Xenopus laevis]